MKIGVIGPMDPASLKDFFPEGTSLPSINKTASSVNAYIRGLLLSGQEVTVVTTDPTGKRELTLTGNGIKIAIVPFGFRIKGFGRYRMHRRIRERVIKELPGLDVLHAQWTYEFALAVKPLARELPVFCTVRDWAPYLITIAKGLKNRYFWGMSLAIFKSVMREKHIRLIANSEYTRARIDAAFPGREVSVIPNPLKQEHILEKRESYPDSPVFVSISQSLTNPRKNYGTLLRAFSIYRRERPDARLILIGGFTEEWKREQEESGLLGSVELMGSLEHDDIFPVLDGASCLIHPSLEETFGNILLEGMSRRVLCIGGKDSGAVPQVLGQGEYGVLCDVTDEASTVLAMKRAEDSENARRIIDKSTRYLLDNFTEKRIAARHIELFESVLRLRGNR